MPESTKQIVIEHLQSGKFTECRRKEIDKIIEFIKQGPSGDASEFRTKMKELDRIRGENYAETHPEMANALNYDAT